MRSRTLALLILPLFGSLAFERVAAAQNRLSQSVFGNGGAVIRDSTFRIFGTVGQSGIGATSNLSNAIKGGFWYLSRGVITRVDQPDRTPPTEYQLKQNYPNPFNPSTTIAFALPRPGRVTLKVYNSLGEEIATLVDEELAAGSYKVSWEAKGLVSGVYFYRLQAGSFEQTKKLVLMR